MKIAQFILFAITLSIFSYMDVKSSETPIDQKKIADNKPLKKPKIVKAYKSKDKKVI